jgi:hypothetical protein
MGSTDTIESVFDAVMYQKGKHGMFCCACYAFALRFAAVRCAVLCFRVI